MADTKISALTDGTTAELSDRIPVARDPTGTPLSRYISVQYIITKVLSLANTWSLQQSFAGGTIAAPTLKLGSAQTGITVDSGTASQLSLIYAGTEHVRIGFNVVQFIASSGIGVSGANGLWLGSSAAASVPKIDASSTTLRVRLGDGSDHAPVSAAYVNSAKAYTVATLPTGAVGHIARVTDASAPAVGSTVSGGGAAAALVWYNGSAWTVIGV